MSYQYKANPYLCNVKSREPDSGAYNLQSISALLLKGLVHETSVMLPMVTWKWNKHHLYLPLPGAIRPSVLSIDA